MILESSLMESLKTRFSKSPQKQNHMILEPTFLQPTHLPITNHVNRITVTLLRPPMENQKQNHMIRRHR